MRILCASYGRFNFINVQLYFRVRARVCVCARMRACELAPGRAAAAAAAAGCNYFAINTLQLLTHVHVAGGCAEN